MVACNVDTQVSAPDITPPDISIEEGEDGDVMPDDTTRGRDRRRMDIDQLDATIQRVTGGVAWTRGTTNQFDRFSETLGVPDYIQATTEDLAISPLFLKFLDDAATSVCTELMNRERDGESDVFLRHATLDSELPADQSAIDENLRYLLLRFHGRSVDASSSEIDPWRDLYGTAHTAAEENNGWEAWRAVCVGLIDHPDFYTY